MQRQRRAPKPKKIFSPDDFMGIEPTYVLHHHSTPMASDSRRGSLKTRRPLNWGRSLRIEVTPAPVVNSRGRLLKKKRVFSPNDYKGPVRKVLSPASRLARLENRSKTPDKANKWKRYLKRFKSLTQSLKNNDHFLTVNLAEKRDAVQSLEVHYPEVNRLQMKMLGLKKSLRALMREICDENAMHTRWSALDGDGDDDENVDLSNVFCSVCGGHDTPSNDILICDRQRCCRAYHQNCLDPPISHLENADCDTSNDWFCWQCGCIDECLDEASDYVGELLTDEHNLFPELEHEEAELAARMDLTASSSSSSLGQQALQPVAGSIFDLNCGSDTESDDESYTESGDEGTDTEEREAIIRRGEGSVGGRADAAEDSSGDNDDPMSHGDDSMVNSEEDDDFDEETNALLLSPRTCNEAPSPRYRDRELETGASTYDADNADGTDADADEVCAANIVCGRRKRQENVDYKKLALQMFGDAKDEDEDDGWEGESPDKGAR